MRVRLLTPTKLDSGGGRVKMVVLGDVGMGRCKLNEIYTYSRQRLDLSQIYPACESEHCR